MIKCGTTQYFQIMNTICSKDSLELLMRKAIIRIKVITIIWADSIRHKVILETACLMEHSLIILTINLLDWIIVTYLGNNHSTNKLVHKWGKVIWISKWITVIFLGERQL